MVKYRWVRMGTEKKRFLYQPSGSADKKTFDYASSAGCIAPDSWAAPTTRAAGGESSVRQVQQVRQVRLVRLVRPVRADSRAAVAARAASGKQAKRS